MPMKIKLLAAALTAGLAMTTAATAFAADEPEIPRKYVDVRELRIINKA